MQRRRRSIAGASHSSPSAEACRTSHSSSTPFCAHLSLQCNRRQCRLVPNQQLSPLLHCLPYPLIDSNIRKYHLEWFFPPPMHKLTISTFSCRGKVSTQTCFFAMVSSACVSHLCTSMEASYTSRNNAYPYVRHFWAILPLEVRRRRCELD